LRAHVPFVVRSSGHHIGAALQTTRGLLIAVACCAVMLVGTLLTILPCHVGPPLLAGAILINRPAVRTICHTLHACCGWGLLGMRKVTGMPWRKWACVVGLLLAVICPRCRWLHTSLCAGLLAFGVCGAFVRPVNCRVRCDLQLTVLVSCVCVVFVFPAWAAGVGVVDSVILPVSAATLVAASAASAVVSGVVAKAGMSPNTIASNEKTAGMCTPSKLTDAYGGCAVSSTDSHEHTHAVLCGLPEQLTSSLQADAFDNNVAHVAALLRGGDALSRAADGSVVRIPSVADSYARCS
jgi:hypothetical protein